MRTPRRAGAGPLVPVLGLVLGLLASCYEPELSPLRLRYRCDGQSPACPSGLRCLRGLCVDPEEGRGCLSQIGAKVGPDAYACPGLFARGKAAGLCAPEYEPCATGIAIDAARCGGRGFFASRVQAARAPGGEACGALAATEATLLLLGCGELAGATSRIARACEGLDVALDCARTTRWICNSGLDDAVNQDEPESGVLCCKAATR